MIQSFHIYLMSGMQPVDGCTAAAHIAYFFSDNAIIYPITPSSPMAEFIDAWAASGRLNGFGEVVRVDEMNHEAGAIGALHGAMLTGSLCSTFTASEGLLLMIPNLYKLCGEHLPVVLHVAARTVATHALAIHGDHGDIMATRETGVSILVSPDVEEAMDFAICAHLASINAMHPFIHAFDGFRTSHTIKKIELIDYQKIAPFVPHEKIAEFRAMALSPEHPTCFGSCQGPPVWLQAAEADNTHYSKISGKVIEAFKVVEQITGRKYEIMDYIGAPDATDVVICMGSGCVTVRETINYLVAQGRKVGAIFVYLYRPFDIEYFISKLPVTARRICVLDRCKEPGAAGEPLRLDVVSSLVETGRYNSIEKVIGGRFGEASKDFIPADVVSVFDNLCSAKPIDHFVCSINDDVTHKSLPRKNLLTLVPEGTKECMFFGEGSDGTVGANKNAIKIISDNTPLYTQGYFDYDSFKAGGLTTSHLRFGPNKIGCEYYVYDSDFTAVSEESYWNKYHTMLVENCREGSILLLNTSCKTAEDLNACMPESMRQMIVEKKLQVKLMDASEIAADVGLPGRINSSIETAFFLLSGVLPEDEAIAIWKKTIEKTFKKKGEKVIDENIAQVDETIKEGRILSLKYPDNWGTAPDGEDVKYFNSIMAKATVGAPDFIQKVFMPTALGEGEKLPVSAFSIRGSEMTGTTRFYKRAIATSVPIWDSTTCIQCMQCVIVCPHAVIRPYLLNAEESAKLPADIKALDCKNPVAKKYGDFKLVLEASPLDCTGCAVCVKTCPMAKEKGTLKLEHLLEVEKTEYKKWSFLEDHVTNKAENFNLDERTEAFYFRTPHFEYHGACAGCGETAYVTHMCRLFGHRMIIANATGCSSIYGFSFPYNPYGLNSKGQGPAWANSLFEDNAEFGFGMVCALNQRRDKLKSVAKSVIEKEGTPEDLKAAFKAWLENADKLEESESTGNAVKAILKKMKPSDCETYKYLLSEESLELYSRPVIYLQGGDGWAYDIGYGGLDHIMASGLDFTLMVLDTEVYSNTGGERSKATPMGAVARFAAGGKSNDKKDLGLICMSYRDVYVASINLAANYSHAVKSMREAVEHSGPSLLIAYCPCMEHGEDMSETSDAQKLAAQTGYWLSYTRRPHIGVTLVTPKPSKPVAEFLNKETRFKQLTVSKPNDAAVLAQKLQEFIDERFANYTLLAANAKKE